MELISKISYDKIRTIAVDFDGTLCKKRKFPQIGNPNIELIEWLKKQQQNGIKIILWSCRENDDLNVAVQWCENYGLKFDAINENIPSYGFQTRKVVADLNIDDRSGIPVCEEKK